MVSLEELRRENAKLKAQVEVRQDFTRRNREKAQLMRENVRLRHPGRARFFEGVGRVGKTLGSAAKRKYSQSKQRTRTRVRSRIRPRKPINWF